MPTNNVPKRFVAKKVSGNTHNVKTELKVEVTNDVSVKKALRRFRETGAQNVFIKLYSKLMVPGAFPPPNLLCSGQWSRGEILQC